MTNLSSVEPLPCLRASSLSLWSPSVSTPLVFFSSLCPYRYLFPSSTDRLSPPSSPLCFFLSVIVCHEDSRHNSLGPLAPSPVVLFPQSFKALSAIGSQNSVLSARLYVQFLCESSCLLVSWIQLDKYFCPTISFSFFLYSPPPLVNQSQLLDVY